VPTSLYNTSGETSSPSRVCLSKGTSSSARVAKRVVVTWSSIIVYRQASESGGLVVRHTRRRVNGMRLTEWRRELIPQVRWCISKRAVGDLWWRRYLTKITISYLLITMPRKIADNHLIAAKYCIFHDLQRFSAAKMTFKVIRGHQISSGSMKNTKVSVNVQLKLQCENWPKRTRGSDVEMFECLK